MASSSSSASPATQAWHHAIKLRKHLQKQLDKIKAGTTSGFNIKHMEAVEATLEQFRLACVQTIFLDFDYAVSENSEDALWSSHISINKEYRALLARLKQASHAVERRKAEKLYGNFLRIAQKFYKAYIQRLNARYDLQELKRIARGIDVEQMTADDAISPVPDTLSRNVLQSCHSTLIRLGDLARYRVQAKQKKVGYDAALLFYGLAHQLVPNNGFAFHQMGIVSIDQDSHLDIVYHFYRSWAIQQPHPNAQQNVEKEFKAVQSSASKKGASRPEDALAMWFVRLHAFFYKGEPFAQQKELESEVMHRLKLAAENPESRTMLLTMAMVNMSAHYIASMKYTANPKSQNAARFYQFILRFNVVFLWTLSSFLEKDLQESLNQSNERVKDAGSSAKTSKAAEALLSVLRLYCIWLGTYRNELFGPSSALGNEIPVMVASLSQVFTLICTETYGHDNLASCPYLLSEDLDILGLQPLAIEVVPEPCRCFCDGNGSQKPMLQSASHRLDSNSEKLSRILDILRCAYFLASDESVPVSQTVVNDYLVFEYSPVVTQSNPASVPPQSISRPQTKDVPSPDSKANTESAISAMVVDVEQQPDEQSTGVLGDPENTVINMLTPFLRPPTPDAQSSRSGADETSYNVSNTGNEALGIFDNDPSPAKSIPSGKFAPLPWDWFNTPKPANSDKHNNGSNSAGFVSNVSPGLSPLPTAGNSARFEDPFYTVAQHTAIRSNHTYMSRSFSGAPRLQNEEAHRSQLLQSLTSDRPQVSPFSEWANRQKPNERANMGQASWGFPSGLPNSSVASGFSHPSSLYQGTPGQAAFHGHNPGRSLSYGQPPQSPYLEQEQAGFGARHFRMDDKTTSYDKAIFKAAYDEEK